MLPIHNAVYTGSCLTMHCTLQRTKEFQDAAFRFVTENVNRPSRISLRHLVAALIDPLGQNGLVAAPEADEAPLFPAAGTRFFAFESNAEPIDSGCDFEVHVCVELVALVVEAYEAMGLVNKQKLTANAAPISAASVTPRHLVSRNKIQFRPEANATFGSIIPIRLY